jgi:CRISPR/Cas system CMR-associated protein Cmr5 small subunit
LVIPNNGLKKHLVFWRSRQRVIGRVQRVTVAFASVPEVLNRGEDDLSL